MMTLYYKTDTLKGPIPEELRPYLQFVCWRYQWNKKKKRREKVPINPRTLKQASSTNPDTWSIGDHAIAVAQEHGFDGIGFVLTPEDPFSFIDLDDVRDPKTGTIEPWAMEIVERFDSYCEVSPSGTGLHIIVRGQLPGVGKKGTKPTELFVSSGYVTITGNTLDGYVAFEERQDELESFYETHCKPETPISEPPTPSVGSSTLTESELLEKARNGALGSKFVSLFDAGDISVSKNDHSGADKDLMCMLAFWTCKDARRMEQLFSDSALGQREKWTDRPDYRRRTIQYALKHTHKVYGSDSPNETKVRDRIRESLAYALLSHNWSVAGRADAAATDYFGYRAFLRMAYKANSLEVHMDVRRFMEETGIARHETAAKSLARLENKHRLVKKVRDGDGQVSDLL